MKKIFLALLPLFLVLSFHFACAQEEEATGKQSKFMVLPFTGFGFGLHNGETGSLFRAGSMFLLRADEKKQFGITGAFIRYMPSEGESPVDFGLVGIQLRMQPSRFFSSSIGTVGYLGLKNASENYFGVSTKLDFKPFEKAGLWIGFDTDFILAKTPYILNYLSLSFVLG